MALREEKHGYVARQQSRSTTFKNESQQVNTQADQFKSLFLTTNSENHTQKWSGSQLQQLQVVSDLPPYAAISQTNGSLTPELAREVIDRLVETKKHEIIALVRKVISYNFLNPKPVLRNQY